MKHNNIKKSAFTLAEVLIVLGIIGIVAAMAIPTLMTKIQDHEFKVAYKKAFAVASNTFNMVKANGDEFYALKDVYDGENGCKNWELFKAQFKVIKTCENNNTDQCWDKSGETSNGSPLSNSPSFVDASGFSWSFRGYCPAGTNSDISFFLVDTNGNKKPNQYGKDRWRIILKLNNASQPIGINIDNDINKSNAWACPTPPCYYKSWLME